MADLVRHPASALVAAAGGLIALGSSGFSMPGQIVVIGALTGLVYASLAAGLVLVYRATRIINFAHAEIGALGAAWLAKLVLDLHVPWPLALVIVVAGGAAVGAILELAVVRRLFHRPRLVLLVATIGLSQIVYVVRAASVHIDNVAAYPSPIDRVVELFDLRIFGDGLLTLVVIPAIIVGLGYLLTATPYGVAIRASAENVEAAELAGISVKRISTLVWSLSGAIAVVSVVAAAPLTNFQAALAVPASGPTLLLRALAAALVGRLVSLPLALVGGVGVGIVEALLINELSLAQTNLALAVLVVVLVLVRGRGDRGESASTFSMTPRLSAVPAKLRDVAWVRRLPAAVAGAGIAIAVVAPLLPGLGRPSNTQTLAQVLIFAIIGLSVTVLTGWAGQLSLGQFAFVGCGAALTTNLVGKGMPFGPAIAYATIATIGLAIIIGLPALRVRGLFLAVTTLGFAVAVDSYVVPELLGDSTGVPLVPRPELGPIDFASQRSYYYLCLVVLALCLYLCSRLRRSGIGRILIATRENEASASAFTVNPVRAKLIAFAVSGGLAALAGGLLAGLFVQVRPDAYGPEQSLRVVAMAILGGLGTVPGAVLGAVWVVGLTAILGSEPEIRALTTAPFLLVLLLYLPGGFMEAVYRARTALLAWAADRAPDLEVRSVRGDSAERAARRPRPASDDELVDTASPALAVRDVTVHFGGVVAVDAVDLDVRRGEIVGLIGSNGAGKSTLMNAISGLVRSTGTILLDGEEISHLPPHERSRRGLGRAFQDARLFDDLTVTDSIKVALEARHASELVPCALGLPPARRAEERASLDAADVIDLLGLGRYAGMHIAALSTGTRRIAELACLLALDSRTLLLDEPTAGVAQAEAEVFGPLIQRIRRELDASVLIIEHDIPLVMSLSDRVYCMGAGRIIAAGLPHEVREDPEVISSYLGTDDRAIQRSGSAS